MNEFDVLAKPKVDRSEQDYILSDKDLFNKVVERNMSHGVNHQEHM